MQGLFDRFLHGECEAVWNELLGFGSVRGNQSLYEEADAIAHETMKRVRQNLELVVPRLEALGYQFGYEWMRYPNDILFEPSLVEWIASQPVRYRPPSTDTVNMVAQFEQKVGPLPLSLRAFYLEVGTVNFVGRHEEWGKLSHEYNPYHLAPTGLDPLFVWGCDKEISSYYDYWQEEAKDDDASRERPFCVPVAPDFNLKYHASGSGCYEIALPNAATDAPLLNEWHNTTFVHYLRICFQYGGLPGLERVRSEIAEELTFLRKNLLPF